MFVDIKEFKGALEIENMLTPFKRGKAEITPEVCYRVLEATNYKRNIRDMLECILKLPAEKQAEFREAVLSTFDNREQPNEVLVLGKKLAVLGGYEDKLEDAMRTESGAFYLKSRMAGADRWFITEQKSWKGDERLPYEKMRFLTYEANLVHVQNMPAELDVLNCRKVKLEGCDLAATKSPEFADGAEAFLASAANIPADLDVSRCSTVDLSWCNLSEIKGLKFAKGAKVELYNAKIPAELDVSPCRLVHMDYCDLSAVESLKFKNRKQMAESRVEIPEGWGGKAIFADEEKTAKTKRANGPAEKMKQFWGGR